MKNGRIVPNGNEVNRALWTKKTNLLRANSAVNTGNDRSNRIGLLYPCYTLAITLRHFYRYAAMLLCLLTIGVGNAWGSATYKYRLKTVTQNNTGLGRVYASDANATPEDYSSYYASNDNAYSAVTSNSGTYYLYALPAQRGVVFDKWTTSSTSSSNCTAGSSTLTNPTYMQGASVSIKAPTSASGTSTYTTTATVTANWKDQYSKVAVTYATPVDGKYRVTYEYSYLNTSTNALETGFTFDMDGSSAARVEDSYNNDVITLQSLDGVFEGWYNGSTLLSTDNPYTYVAPASGESVTISAHYTHVDKYYGKLTASIAEVPYSMPGGGTIFIANDPDATGTYSDAAQQVSNTTFGATQTYYLHAQPTDKRYVFRGWYSNPECTGAVLSTSADYTYTFTATSMNSADPTLGNVYAAFDFNLYYMQVETEPAVPGLGMVLVSDTKLATAPEYTAFSTHAEQFSYAYRLRPTADVYLYAKPKYGYKLEGWYTDVDCTVAATVAADGKYTATGSSTDPMNPTITKLYAKFVEDAEKVSITYTIPDKTKGEYTASVLDIAEENDDFVWTFTEVYNSVDYTANTTLSQNKTDVLKLEAHPKAGYGVTSWTEGSTPKTTPSHLYETSATAAKTLSVAFGDAKPFLVSTNSTQYATLREALTAVGSSGQITVVQNAYVEAGDYIIPSGVTLLVPYESTGESYTSPSKNYEKIQEFSSATQYILLTLSTGVNISLSGNLIVMADLCAPVGGGAGSGAPLSAYGRIAMLENSTITVNSGANLYCWGYITGKEGLVTAKSGAKIHEIFQHQNNPGGSAASGWNEEAFFLNQYYVQNIESPLKIEYGAIETVYAQMTVPSSTINNLSASLIGKDDVGMFALTSSGSYLIRTYDPSTDRITYDIYGNAKLNYISMSVYGMDLNTSKYVLPITSNMSVKCHTLNGNASTFNIQYAVSFIPGAELFADEGVTLNIQNKLIIYDRDEWIGKNFAQFNKYSGGYNWTRSSFTPTRTYIRVNADLVDAKVDLNGTMNVSGSLYTTNSGATIISSNGTGVVKLSSSAPGNSNDIQYSANKLGASIKVPMTPAQLRNGDDSYTLTAGAVANDQFIYSKSQEKWLKNPKVVSWNANGGTTEASTMAYSEGAFIGELPAAYKDGYTLEGWYTAADGGTKIDATTKVTANITYYAHWTPKSYTITYRDLQGVAFTGAHVDTPNAHPTTHTFGTETALTGATKEHYTFGGWYRTPSCSGAVVTSIAASECKNITLYAKWTINSHNLTWDANGGELSGDYTSGTVNYGTAIIAPTAFRENYVFNGWTPTPVETMPDEGDLTYTAQWEPAVASVTVSGVTTNFTTLQAAFDFAQSKSSPTVTVLKDINLGTDNAVYTNSVKNSVVVFELNGHKVSGACTQLLYITGSVAFTFRIQDSSAGQTGQIYDRLSSNKARCCVLAYYGIVELLSGTVYMENYNTGTSVQAYGVQVRSGSSYKFNMKGGTIEVHSTRQAIGIYSAGTTTVTGGKIIVKETRNGYASGISVINGTTTISDDADIDVTGTKNVRAALVGGNTPSDKGGLYNGKLNITGGKFTVKASANTAYGVYSYGGIKAINYATNATYAGNYACAGTANISGGEFDVTSAGATAYGVFVNKPATIATALKEDGVETYPEATATPKANITGGKFNVSGASSVGAVNTNAANTDLVVTGGWYNDATNLASKYTAPAKDCNYHVLPLTSEEPYKYEVAEAYTITFKNGDEVLQSTAVKEGATPTYNGTTPTKDADVQYTYTFKGWSPAVASVTADATYTATFTPSLAKYTIIWLNYDGSEIDRTDVEYGTMPTHDDPTRESTVQYDFPFTGWSPALTEVTGNATYTATFNTPVIRSYNVTWQNYDGTKIGEPVSYQYGTQPSYKDATPTYSDGTGRLYTFRGWKRESSGIEYAAGATLPEVGGDEVFTAQYDIVSELVATEENPVNINENTTVDVTTVRVSGKLNVSAGTLTTTDLILEATPDTSGEITGEGTITAANVYFDLTGPFKARTWYAVAVPWQVEVPAYDKANCGVFFTNDGLSYAQQELGKTFDLIYYDGALRAQSGHSDACWKYVEDDGTTEIMQPGKAYMIYLASDANTIRFKKKAGASIHTNSLDVYTYSGNGKDANWNGIANPATFHAYLNAHAKDNTYGENVGQVYDAETRSYTQFKMDENQLVAGQPIYVQVQEEKTVVANQTSYNENPASAPRRAKAYTEMRRLEVTLASEGKAQTDRIIIRTMEDKEDTYTIGQDLVKMGTSDIVPQMWVDRYDSRLCINTVAPVNDVATYPLSLFAPKADEYTVSTDATAEDNVTLYLTFDGRPIWNLTYSPYVTSLEKGTNRHYGLMLIRSKAPEVATGIGDVQDGTQPAAQKILLDGQVYILRGGELYSITGQSIK